MPRLAVLQALVILLVVAWYGAEGAAKKKTDVATTDEDIVLSEVYGGPHGYAFSDMSSITLGQTLSSVTVRGAARIDAISAQAAKPSGSNWDHGGSGGKEYVLTLGSGEYINSMEIHWAKKGTHTRVFYLKFVSNKGNSVSAGTKTANSATVKAPKGFQLGILRTCSVCSGSTRCDLDEKGSETRSAHGSDGDWLVRQEDPKLGGPHHRLEQRHGLLPTNGAL